MRGGMRIFGRLFQPLIARFSLRQIVLPLDVAMMLPTKHQRCQQQGKYQRASPTKAAIA
jgi:hypothetical protein